MLKPDAPREVLIRLLYNAVMEENPYQAPVGAPEIPRIHPPNRMLWALAVGASIGAFMGVATAGALIVAAEVALSRVDLRENPGYWDEFERRTKARMTQIVASDSANSSISEFTAP
jgi:hypothetical protein